MGQISAQNIDFTSISSSQFSDKHCNHLWLYKFIMAASVLVQSVPIAISYVNCYVKHTGLTLFIKMTHGFNLGRSTWRKRYFKPEGLMALCTRKSRQSKIYIWLWTPGAGSGFSSLFQWNSAQAKGFLTCTHKTPKCTVNSKLLQTRTSLKVDWFHAGCEFRFKKEEERKKEKKKFKTKGVFSFFLFFSFVAVLSTFNVFLLDDVSQQATSGPDKATTSSSLSHKKGVTDTPDWQNRKLEAFNTSISSHHPRTRAYKYPRNCPTRQQCSGKRQGENSWLRQFVDLL